MDTLWEMHQNQVLVFFFRSGHEKDPLSFNLVLNKKNMQRVNIQ